MSAWRVWGISLLGVAGLGCWFLAFCASFGVYFYAHPAPSDPPGYSGRMQGLFVLAGLGLGLAGLLAFAGALLVLVRRPALRGAPPPT